MRIGIPKEIKNNENRVAITPAGVIHLVHSGHEVFIQNKLYKLDEKYLFQNA